MHNVKQKMTRVQVQVQLLHRYFSVSLAMYKINHIVKLRHVYTILYVLRSHQLSETCLSIAVIFTALYLCSCRPFSLKIHGPFCCITTKAAWYGQVQVGGNLFKDLCLIFSKKCRTAVLTRAYRLLECEGLNH